MGHPEFKTVDGRREAWLVLPVDGGDVIGGWVCFEDAPELPGGFCGMPVESEPCTVHHPAPPQALSDAVYDVLMPALAERRLIHCATTGQYPPDGVHGIESGEVHDLAERIARVVQALKPVGGAA